MLAARTVDLTKVYGEGDAEVRALDGVTVEIRAGEFTAVMGPSGSGKSTLVHCMAALDSPTSGSVFIGDTDLADLKDKALTLLRRDRVGFVFQAYNLLPTLTAEEKRAPAARHRGGARLIRTGSGPSSTPSACGTG
ncbi:MAG: peptide transporter ATP-binding protein [Aeromicrobium sp.]|jgi:putative ABC transport system ATP-binding protein|nr:peptide transporter ATP-binding protein [Aeromicrobium sp.]